MTQEMLAVKLGIDKLFLRTEIEPFLLERGLIAIPTSRSRVLTTLGVELVQRLQRTSAVVPAMDPEALT